MRLRWKVGAVAGVAGVFALGAFVGTGLGDSGSGWSGAETATMPSHASSAGKLQARGGGGGDPTIRHFLGDPRPVASGAADLVRAKCPKKFPNPVAGGFFTSGPGIVLFNDSRKNPGGATKARSMYIAVANLSGGTLNWRPDVACGKHIKD